MGILTIDDWERHYPPTVVSDYERALKVMTNVDFDELKRCVDAEHARRYQSTHTTNNTRSAIPALLRSGTTILLNPNSPFNTEVKNAQG
jgi:hypothetical protein